jgi:hypothetical protein
MGRPLKIAKAQAVLTITDTAQTGSIVTVTQNLTTSPTVGVAAGMPFVVASTVGGLTAGTTYYINSILSNHTFDVSATQLSVQPQVMATLTDTTGGSVAASVAVVDAYFNNPTGPQWPSTNANTYSVVGGNTSIYGKQVLCNVGFGVNGTGTVFASTSSNVVVGLGTDFANVATGTILFAHWGNDPNVNQLLGTTTSTKGNLNVAVANTTATGNVIGTSGNAQTLTANTPVVFDTTFGGLTAGTTYFVATIANAAAFTVSATPGGPNVALTSNASVSAYAIQNRVVLGAVSANNASGSTGYGDTFAQVLPEAGYIIRQKGKTKYLVKGTVTGIVGQAYTANVANTALTPNTMSIIATNAASGTQYVSSVNDHSSELFPATVAPGSLVPGTLYTIYRTGTTDWTACGAASNITGVTFTATATGSGTGLAVLNTVNPDVIASFNSAAVANAANGQPNPIVTINNA